jgi:hypothetical protein
MAGQAKGPQTDSFAPSRQQIKRAERWLKSGALRVMSAPPNHIAATIRNAKL